MAEHKNQFGQPIGVNVNEWQRPFPNRDPIRGRHCNIEVLDVKTHQNDLCRAFVDESQPEQWTYLAYGPFANRLEFCDWLKSIESQSDPMFHTVVDSSNNRAVGLASFMEIRPRTGVIEVGHIHFSLALQRTIAATEAMYLMMKRAFDELGYRRYEWKCDALNARSRAAALRLGFTFEGTFRQATMYKGRNRDTAWYSITDREWPAVANAFKLWLADENFDEYKMQRRKLVDWMDPREQ